MAAPAANTPQTISVEPEGETVEAIYARYFPFVWRCLRALGVPPAALDDAAQDVFVVVQRRYGEFRGRSALRTWLYGIVRNVASNQRRGERRRFGRASVLGEVSSAGPGPLELAQDREAADFVQRFLSKMDDGKRDVFILALLEQMSIPEVAETLGIPLNTAYTRLRSARKDFRRVLARHRGS